jgi:DNA-binding HxlR family transcriptional regulator
MSRSYGQFCALAKALDVVGQRWTLLLVRELLLGPRRFKEILLGLPGVPTNLLSARLKHLAAHDLVTQLEDGSYGLTEGGRGLEPVLFAMGNFGERYLGVPSGEHINLRWALNALNRRYGRHLDRTVAELRFKTPANVQFEVRADGAHLAFAEGPALNPDVILAGAPPTILGVLMRGAPTAPLIAQGSLTLTVNDAARADAFLAAFLRTESHV